MISQSSVAIGDARIATWSAGHYGHYGAPVVFLAGGLCDHRSWMPQLEALSGQYHCVAIDPRGCGWSSSAGPYDISRQAQDIATVIEAQEKGPAAVVSHSIGGYAALLLSHIRPDLVTANVFVDVPLSEAGANTELAVQALHKAGSLLPLSGMIDSMGMLADDAVRATIREMMLTRPAEVAVGMLSGLEIVTNNIAGLLTEASRKPCLAIWPGPSPKGGDPKWVARICPSVRQEIVPEAGHFVQLERPAAVSLLIEQFLDGLSSST